MLDDVNEVTKALGRVVRAQRTARGMSLGDLGRATGLSKTILATIERGEGNPSIETLWRVSQSLDLPLGALLEPAAAPRVQVVRARSGRELGSDSGMSAFLIHADGRDHRTELFELNLPDGVEHRSGSHLPGTEEVVFCVTGSVTAGPSDGPVQLAAGDSIWFAADVPHLYRGSGDARAINVMLYAAGGTR